MDKIFQPIKAVFDEHQTTAHIEFEMRLGKINHTMFDTNVGEEVFHKIMRALDRYPNWEDIRQTRTSVYYSNNTRMSIDEETDDRVCVRKIALSKDTFQLSDHRFDVRFTAAVEIPVEEMGDDEVMDTVRVKSRTSFVRKNLSIDMTVVTGDPTDLDSEEDARYEIELEIVAPAKVTGRDELYNIVHKVFDVLKIVE